MEPTTSTSDQNRWWRAACSDTAGKLLDLVGLPVKPIRDLACRAAAPTPKPAPTAVPARDTIDGAIQQGRQAFPTAPHGMKAEAGHSLPSHQEVQHSLELVLEVMGVESKALAATSVVGGVAMLGTFIGEIAKANAEGKHAAGCAATARGFATVMAEVLDRGSLRASTVASLRDRARDMEPKLAARMWLGAQAAAKALHGLNSAERTRIRTELLDRTPHLQVSGSPERQLYYKTQGLLLGWKPARI